MKSILNFAIFFALLSQATYASADLLKILDEINRSTGSSTNCPQSRQTCSTFLTDIHCSFKASDKTPSNDGNCSFRNQKGDLGVIYDDNAKRLFDAITERGVTPSFNTRSFKLGQSKVSCQKNIVISSSESYISCKIY